MEDQTKKQKEHGFALSTFSLKNKTSVFVLTFIILVAGISSYISVPKESFPEVIIPQIYIGTAYPGYSPEDIEKLITRPLEKEINSITGIDKIKVIMSYRFSIGFTGVQIHDQIIPSFG